MIVDCGEIVDRLCIKKCVSGVCVLKEGTTQGGGLRRMHGLCGGMCNTGCMQLQQCRNILLLSQETDESSLRSAGRVTTAHLSDARVLGATDFLEVRSTYTHIVTAHRKQKHRGRQNYTRCSTSISLGNQNAQIRITR